MILGCLLGIASVCVGDVRAPHLRLALAGVACSTMALAFAIRALEEL